MCGIIGMSVNKDADMFQKDLGISVFKKMIIENTSRGKDSTGITYITEDTKELDKNTYRGLLKGSVAQEFVLPPDDFKGILAHVRHATIGDKKSYLNIHPFSTERYLGVHNGTLTNHKVLKKEFRIDTLGECDSELIYRLMDIEDENSLKYLEGLFALAYVNKENSDDIYVVTNGSRPMTFLEAKDLFVVFGSEGDGSFKVAKEYFVKNLPEHEFRQFEITPGHVYTVRNGRVVDKKDITHLVKLITSKQGEILLKATKNNPMYQCPVPTTHRITTKEVTPKRVPVSKPQKTYTTYNSKKEGTIVASKSSQHYWDSTYKNLISLLKRRLQEPTDYIHTAFDYNILGNIVPFGTNAQCFEFLYNNVFSNNTQGMFGLLPLEQDYTSVNLNNLGSIHTLLISIMLSDKVSIFHRDCKFFEDKGITAEAIIAASICSLKKKPILDKLTKFIKEKLVDTRIVRLINTKHVKSFGWSNYLVKNEVVCFDKILLFSNPYNIGKIIDSTIYSDHYLKSKMATHFTKTEYNESDFLIYGKNLIFTTIVSRLLEAISLGRIESRLYKQSGNYMVSTKIGTIVKELYKHYLNHGEDDFKQMFSELENLGGDKMFKTYNKVSEIEGAVKENTMSIVGRDYSLFSKASAADVVYRLNNFRNNEECLEGLKLLLERAITLRSFFVNGEVPHENMQKTVIKS